MTHSTHRTTINIGDRRYCQNTKRDSNDVFSYESEKKYWTLDGNEAVMWQASAVSARERSDTGPGVAQCKVFYFSEVDLDHTEDKQY